MPNVTASLFLMYFQNMLFIFCQTQFLRMQNKLMQNSKKRGYSIIRSYAETCKGICGYNPVYNFFIQLLRFKSYVFCGRLFKCNLAREGVISKSYFLDLNCSFPCNLSYDIQLIQWCECFRKDPRWRVPVPGPKYRSRVPGPTYRSRILGPR